MNRTELIKAVSEKTQIPQKAVSLIFNKIHEVIIDALSEGETVKIAGFGTFKVMDIPSKKVRNFKTGETVIMTSRKTARFKASYNLKESV